MPDRRLLRELQGRPAYLVAMAMNGLTAVMAILLQAFGMAGAVNAVFVGHAGFGRLMPYFAAFFAAATLRALMVWYLERLFRRQAREIRNEVRMRHASRLLSGARNASGSGAGAAVFCEAADAMDVWYAEYLPQFVLVAVTVPVLLLVVLLLDGPSALLMAVTVPTLPVFLALAGAAAKQAGQSRLESLRQLGGTFLEMIRGMETLRLFDRIGTGRRHVAADSEAFRKTTMEVLKVSFLSAFVLELAATISTALVAVSLGLRLTYGHIAFYPAFFVLMLTPDFYQAIRRLGARYHAGTAGKAAADALWVPVDARADAQAEASFGSARAADAREAAPSGRVRYSDALVLDHLTYRYPDASQAALSDVSAVLEPGRPTLLLGASGAGKTTLAHLLLGLMPAESGTLRWSRDGSPLLRGQATLVPQHPFLFRGTVMENIRFSRPDATEAQVVAAAVLADADTFIREMPGEYEAPVWEEGANLSGGQAQRLAIARAFLQDAPLIILDEGTSALDAETEHRIRTAALTLARDRIVLVIAHRLEMLEDAEQILVLDQGVLAGAGSREALWDGCCAFRTLLGSGGEAEG